MKLNPKIEIPTQWWPLDPVHPDATHDGTSGNDVMQGRIRHTDIMYGDGGNDTIYSGGGVDRLYGGSGNDTLVAEYVQMSDYPRSKGTSLLDGGSGDDTLIVAANAVGKFSLVGGTGDDDFIIRGDGPTTLSGGTGADRFSFASTFSGTATITDFEIGTDHFAAGGARPHLIGNVDGDALFMTGPDAFVILDGVSEQMARIAYTSLFEF